MFSKQLVNITVPWQDLAKYSVTVQRGSVWLTVMAKQYAKEVQELATPKQMLNFVKYGRADIALMPLEATDILASKEFQGSGIKQVGPVLSTLAIHSFVHKRHKALVPKLAFALHQMKLDGSYQRLIKQSRIEQQL
ncbi:MAG: amino acid ABC transporter substrate-binding protein [Colwellia sp.]|nr:amino acid ABC transporter substrate-binding protein [Colwellia sp.]